LSDFAKVFRIQLKARFGFAGSKKDMLKQIGLGLVVVVSVISLAVIWAKFLHYFFTGLKTIGMLDAGLLMPFIAGMLVVLIFGVPGVLGVLFQSRDISFLASLPLKQGSVFASKFFLVYLYELAIMYIFLLPAIIVYGMIDRAGTLFYVKGVLAIFFLPMLPLALSAFLSLLLMRFSGLTKRRELFMVIGGFVLTIGYIVGQNILMARVAQMSEEALLALLQQASGIIRVIGRALPPALWAVSAVLFTGTESLINWLLYLASSIAAFAVVYYIGSKLYLSGALAQLESAKRGKKLSLDTGRLRAGSPVRAMALREFRLIIRSPIYALNSLIGVFLFPAMIFMVPVMSGLDPDLQAIANLAASIPESTVFVFCLGIGFLFCTTNMAAPTVLSREGTHVWLSKVIPVPYRTQAFGKLLFSWSINAATQILGLVVAMILFPGLAVQTVLACICALIGAVALAAVCMMIDISRPKLKWSSEAEAIKQNLNGLFGMILTVVLGAGFVYLSYIFSTIVNVYVNFLLTLLVVSAVAATSVILLGRLADVRYSKLEL
jgi:ABC-2 type transport system permease protein